MALLSSFRSFRCIGRIRFFFIYRRSRKNACRGRFKLISLKKEDFHYSVWQERLSETLCMGIILYNNPFFIYLIANHLLALSNVRFKAISWNTISSISPPASTQPGTATEGGDSTLLFRLANSYMSFYLSFCFLLSKSIFTCIFLVLLFSLCRRRKPHTPTSSKGTKGL